ncbi:type II toxin-antitoxin system VapC family toxin [Chroococcidiopsis sp. FACHB-1243]|uniref:type II toxin-antitoxin system VapC family toxin n=1 Tax=Chroococcidiopsis sp. [FACHB-1243] TaxID=2692781 RepID=UPI0017832AD2|nr:type II toxin-antitoxin system VapC family toxin [Chroococcidiopsis sp. [FACHB-1243]]MBD2307999.1 type II toxin-antitoxin system VapC family toxin [Chroococcidiopsis sp. [FACHB-1243]]
MRLLLDTHTFIWFVTNSSQLSIAVKELIEDENNEKLLSIASIWEMAIKQSIGKLRFSQPFQVFVQQQLSINSIDVLNININHLTVVSSLPLHHRDPFDRLFISQAMVAQLSILSIDSAFDSYPIQRLW